MINQNPDEDYLDEDYLDLDILTLDEIFDEDLIALVRVDSISRDRYDVTVKPLEVFKGTPVDSYLIGATKLLGLYDIKWFVVDEICLIICRDLSGKHLSTGYVGRMPIVRFENQVYAAVLYPGVDVPENVRHIVVQTTQEMDVDMSLLPSAASSRALNVKVTVAKGSYLLLWADLVAYLKSITS